MTEKTLEQLKEKLAKATLKSARKLEKLQMRIEEKEAIANGWEVVVDYHDDMGKPKIQRRYYIDQQGREQGTHRAWCKSGNLSWVHEYKDGKLHGRGCAYYEDGSTQETSMYVGGVKQGASIIVSNNHIVGVNLYNGGKLVAYINPEVNPDALGKKESAEEESI